VPVSSRPPPSPDCARARRHVADDGRADLRTRHPDRPRARCPPRRRDLPVVLSKPKLGHLRRDPALRDRRLPRTLPPPRRDRRRRRPSPRRRRIRQTQDREVPVGVQQTTTQRTSRPGTRQQALEPLGRRPLRPRPPTRAQPPPRTTHPRPRLEPNHLALLAHPHPYDPNRHTGLQQHITVTIPSQTGPRPDQHATQQMAGPTLLSTPNPTPA
jgi:hypothetical protein